MALWANRVLVCSFLTHAAVMEEAGEGLFQGCQVSLGLPGLVVSPGDAHCKGQKSLRTKGQK